jgi:hypothetical protein
MSHLIQDIAFAALLLAPTARAAAVGWNRDQSANFPDAMREALTGLDGVRGVDRQLIKQALSRRPPTVTEKAK